MSTTETQNHLRNIAIIAHVDHGKTTLVDGMLKQGGAFRAHQAVAERVMDKMDLERERGITIVSKHNAITYGDVKINIVDTPGHADFGGEVERVMSLVDGVLLLIDAVEGPMPQTRFVLSKALQAGHKAVVVVNKIDRPNARLDWVVDQTFDLFVALGANDAQLDFPVVYTNALQGTATLEAATPGQNLTPLFETVISHLDPPTGDPAAPTQLRVTTLDYDDYKGRIAIGRVNAGTVKTGQSVAVITRTGDIAAGKLAQVFVYQGLNRAEVDEAQAGEIVAVSGLPDVGIGETIADRANPIAMPPMFVDEPTLRMTFGVNTSPLAGREGTYSTSRKIRERLFKELQTNVALRVADTDTADQFLVSGRGELHLAVLIETMRREGYELQVSQPEVIFHEGRESAHGAAGKRGGGRRRGILRRGHRGVEPPQGRDAEYASRWVRTRPPALQDSDARPARLPQPVPDHDARHRRPERPLRRVTRPSPGRWGWKRTARCWPRSPA